MARSLSPVVRRELANLDKDADSRKSAMKVLKSYVRDLDSKAIPLFLAQVFETKETGSLPGEYTISLYEVLARVHGTNIVPQIDSIMSSIVKTLASSAGSFPLQQACSKVVPAIARYGIDPTTPEDKKRHIIHSLCMPLSECLLASQGCLSSGAALCLEALVDTDNWRYASDEMVNRVCQNVAVALDGKSTQSNLHMGLVMALAKHNSLIVEAYARLLLHSGLRILNAGVTEGNSQKRLSSIQMVNFLLKCLDPRSVYSEIELLIQEMEKCQSDEMPFVKGAAFEALQTARRILGEKESKFEKDSSSVTRSNFRRRDHTQRRNGWGSGEKSSKSASPESWTLDSFADYDSLLQTPKMSRQGVSPDFELDRGSVNRKLWKFENGGVDISLKDGLFSEFANGNGPHSGDLDLGDSGGEQTDEFKGFVHRNLLNGTSSRSCTPSPQRSPSRINEDSIKIFTTPRKLIRSLQDSSESNDESPENQTRWLRSPCSSQNEWSPLRMCDVKELQNRENHDSKENGNISAGKEELQCTFDSVSSTGYVAAVMDNRAYDKMMLKDRTGSKTFTNKKTPRTILATIFCLFFLALIPSIWVDNMPEAGRLVPT